MKVVTYRSFEPGLSQLESRKLITAPSALESAAPPPAGGAEAYLAEALSALRAQAGEPGVLVAPPHQLGSLLQTYLTEHQNDLDLLEEPGPAGTLEVKFDKGDLLGWARSALEWWRKIKPEKWLEPPERAERIGDGKSLRVAVLGDWGTGLYGAPVSARSIEADPAGYELLLHLGDVYYSGTPKEVRENFLAFWPDVPGAISRALNSNHEMYSGGEGLFRETLPAFGQASTCCAIELDDWLLVGLDSAYAEHDLAQHQAAWLAGLLADAGDRKLILFSHHQPYSLLDKQGPKMAAKLDDVLRARRVHAWYWGHEHRCVIYNTHLAWGLHGRCIGHGGFPHYRDDVTTYDSDHDDERWRRVPGRDLIPGGVLLDMPNEYIGEHGERYGAHGYVTLEFDGPSLTEVFRSSDGAELRIQKLD